VQKRKASLRRGSPVQPPVTYDLRLRPPTATHSPTPTYKAARPSVGAAASALLLPPLLACGAAARPLHVCTAPTTHPVSLCCRGRPSSSSRPDRQHRTGPDPRLPRPANRPGPSEPVVRGGSPTGSLFVRMPQLRVSLYSLQRDHTKSSLPHLPPASALLSPVPAQKHLHPLPTATAAASSPFPPAFALLVVSSV
jgi:hypothetical protein